MNMQMNIQLVHMKQTYNICANICTKLWPNILNAQYYISGQLLSLHTSFLEGKVEKNLSAKGLFFLSAKSLCLPKISYSSIRIYYVEWFILVLYCIILDLVRSTDVL